MNVSQSQVSAATPESMSDPDGGRSAPVPSSAGVSWQRLLRWAGAAEAAALLVVAAVLADVEAAAIGAGFVVGLALLRVRTGLLGRAAVGLLSANVAGWMLLGLVNILANGDGVRAVVIPATLTALALVGLISAVVTTLRGDGVAGSAAPLPFVGAVAALLVAVIVAGAVTAEDSNRVRPGDLRVGAEQLRFTEAELRASAGTVGVVVTNGDLFWHTFTIDALDVDLAVPVEASRRIAFTAEPGTYEYYCRIPGHEALMTGTLIVD